jgi:hypothetical protein
MEHVVFYPSAEGPQAFKRVDSLDAAVSFVEHLRNSDNITEFSVHALTKVPVSFRAYYHVEVPGEAGEVGDAEAPYQHDEAPSDAVGADDDRSAEWVAEADIFEPPAAVPPAPVDEPAPADPFAETAFDSPADVDADADAMAESVNGDVIPSGRRSMGFFSR